MRILKPVLLPLCLLILSPAASADETKDLSKPADKELDMQGLWVAKDEDDGMEHLRMGMDVESLRISMDGTKYLVEIIGERPGQYRTLAIREGDELKIGMLLLGNIIFSDDGERAYFAGSEFRKLPDHKVREFIEDQGVAKIRAECIMHLRNCQQAMRGEQNMKQLKPGDPFTKADLEEYLKFPEDIQVEGGWIRFKPGNKITPESANPARNGDHLWLRIEAPDTVDYIGKFGWDDITEVTGW